MKWDYTIVDDLNSEEIKSLLASNRIPRELIKHIKIQLSFRVIKELIPVMATVIIGKIILDAFIDAVIKD
jgi:hypothetical protein